MKPWFNAHAKALVPAVSTLIGVIVLAVATGGVDQAELEAALVGLAVSAGVYRIPNAK